MGCDIHMFVEYRLSPTSSWQAAPEHTNLKEDDYERVDEVSSVGRNYELFAALAGVRGEGPDPRGVPDNVSDMVKLAIEQWDGDGHSHSYCSLDEFEEILRKVGEEYFDWSDTSTVAFWDWKDYDYHEKDGKKKPPQDYVTLVNYCRHLQKEYAKVDDIILGGNAEATVDVRLVFFFDN